MATARRGKFGRVPTASPDLTATIISIAQQMTSAEDKNITDAWQQGGMYQGHSVTDAMILDHWHQRMQGIDKTDPMYDQYNNTVMQLEYNIGLEKAQVAYAKSDGGAAADQTMANFYTTWAKTIPPNSEFYRSLQKSAAQFIQTSRSKGAAAAKVAAEANYQASQAHTIATQEAQGVYLTNVVFSILAARGVGVTQSGYKPNETDPAEYAAALSSINGANRSAVLYHDPQTGAPVTVGDVQAQVAKNDPHYAGVVTPAYFHQAITQQQAGQVTTLALAKSTGHASDVTNITTQQANTTSTAAWIANQPIEQSYVQIHDQWMQTWGASGVSPDAALASWAKFGAAITALANDPKRPPDDVTKARLLAEANGNTSLPPLSSDFTGSAQPGTAPNDIALTQADVTRFQAWSDAVVNGTAVWAYGTTKAGAFTPGAGTDIGATSYPQAQAASPAGSVLVYIPQGGGLPMIPVYTAGKTITAKVLDSNGNAVASTSPNADVVGTAYDTVVDGVPTRFYSYTGKDAAGNPVPVYTKSNPWGGPNVTAHDTGTGVELTVRLGFAQSATDPNVTGNPSLFVVKAGVVYVSPVAAVLATNAPRQIAGQDPNTDSFSPTLALNSGTPDSASNIHGMSHDVGFQQNLALDALRGSGGQNADGTAVDPTGFANNTALGASFLADPTHLTGSGRVSGGWDTLSTDPTVVHPAADITAGGLLPGAAASRGLSPGWMTAQPAGAPRLPGAPMPGLGGLPMLPSDMIRTTSFGPLAGVFQPGANTFAGPGAGGAPGPAIKFGHTITVPHVPDSPFTAVTPAPVGLPTTSNPFTSSPGAPGETRLGPPAPIAGPALMPPSSPRISGPRPI